MKMESWFLLLDVILRDMHKRSGYTFIIREITKFLNPWLEYTYFFLVVFESLVLKFLG